MWPAACGGNAVADHGRSCISFLSTSAPRSFRVRRLVARRARCCSSAARLAEPWRDRIDVALGPTIHASSTNQCDDDGVLCTSTWRSSQPCLVEWAQPAGPCRKPSARVHGRRDWVAAQRGLSSDQGLTGAIVLIRMRGRARNTALARPNRAPDIGRVGKDEHLGRTADKRRRRNATVAVTTPSTRPGWPGPRAVATASQGGRRTECLASSRRVGDARLDLAGRRSSGRRFAFSRRRRAVKSSCLRIRERASAWIIAMRAFGNRRGAGTAGHDKRNAVTHG